MRDKVVSSYYSFLINSNIVVPEGEGEGEGGGHNKENERDVSDSERKIKIFKDGLKRIFLSTNILNFIHLMGIRDKVTKVIIPNEDIGTNKKDLIDKINTECVLEIGPRDRKLHAHVTVQIYHRTTLKFMTNDIITYFAQKKKISVFVSPPKIISDFSVNLYQYQVKDVEYKLHLRINSSLIGEGEELNFFHVMK